MSVCPINSPFSVTLASRTGTSSIVATSVTWASLRTSPMNEMEALVSRVNVVFSSVWTVYPSTARGTSPGGGTAPALSVRTVTSNCEV